MRQTEKYILLLLQLTTEGEAKKIVSGIQIGPSCGRLAYAELARIYGRESEVDRESTVAKASDAGVKVKHANGIRRRTIAE